MAIDVLETQEGHCTNLIYPEYPIVRTTRANSMEKSYKKFQFLITENLLRVISMVSGSV